MIHSLAPVTFTSWISLFRKKLAFWFDIVAFIRLNGLVMLALIGASLFVFSVKGEAISTFFDRFTFYNSLALLLGVILAFYVAMIVIPYLWFFIGYYGIRRKRNQILFKFPSESCLLGEPFEVDAIVHKKMRLWFGVIKFRLVFFNYDATDWYYLLKNQYRKGELFNSAERGAIGSFALKFRHLGRFRTRYSVIKFEDPFGFFSLPIVEREYHPIVRELNFHLYSIPPAPVTGSAPYYVKKTNIPSVSEQKFKVAEDFFDSKRYEPTDDSRRIIWKVYSRTRELLIRILDRDSVIDADLDIHVLLYNPTYTADTVIFHALYDRYILDIAALMDLLMRQRALTIHLFTDCDEASQYVYDPNLTHEENLKRHLVSGYWHRVFTPAVSIEHFLAQRARARERILVVHPGIRLGDLPQESLSLYSGLFLLGAGYRERGMRADGFSPIRIGNESLWSAASRRMTTSGLFRTLDANSAGLRARFKVGLDHGDN